jgi:glycosyltransferase involved in cell wall biosynthesis
VRIGLLAPPWVPTPPVGYGGTEAVVALLARGLQSAGHDVVLYATGDSTAGVATVWTYEAAVGFTRGVECVLLEAAHVCEAYELFSDVGVDVVHDHTVAGPLRALAGHRSAVVTTVHGPIEGAQLPVLRAVAGSVAIVAISRHQASRAPDVPVDAVIHHGIDVAAVEPGTGDGGYALFLGRMCPDKGVHTAIDVARAAGVPLRIAAKLRERQELEYFRDVVEPRLGGDVEYTGEADVDEKWALLRGARCLLDPISWPEPFGMVVLEALAAGTPVVATPCGALPEIVDDGSTGFLRADVAGLAAAVADVDRLDRAVCRRAAEARFSADRLVADHVELYERIAEPSAALGA